jgi:hypothetical protein
MAQFMPGQSGNPAGRPKKEQCLTETLRKIADEPLTPEGLTRREALARLLWDKALVDGDMPAIKYLYDRVDGLPVAKQEISGTDGEPLEVMVRFGKG